MDLNYFQPKIKLEIFSSRFVLEVRKVKIPAVEMEAPHQYVKLFPEDGTQLDLSPGVLVVGLKVDQRFTQMFMNIWTSYIQLTLDCSALLLNKYNSVLNRFTLAISESWSQCTLWQSNPLESHGLGLSPNLFWIKSYTLEPNLIYFVFN